jgi:pimeloyl-ACP methyl ester carboxylesterase
MAQTWTWTASPSSGISRGANWRCAQRPRAHPVSAEPAPTALAPAAVCGLAAAGDLRKAFAAHSGNGAVRAFLGGSPQDRPERYSEASPSRLLPLGLRQLLLHGTADDAIPVEHSRAYVRRARNAGDDVDYVELPGMGHMAYLDPAGAAHDVLCTWLSTAIGARGSPGSR